MKRLVASALVAIALAGCAAYYGGPESEHFDGTRFFNPAPMPERGLTDFLRWQFTRQPEKWPDRIENPQVGKPVARVEGEQMIITMIGHAGTLIQSGGLNVLTDPVWSETVGPFNMFGATRKREPGIAFVDLPKIDVVVISHNHYDHMDVPSLRMVWERDRPKIVVPLGNDAIVRDNIAGAEAIALDWGAKLDLGKGAQIIAAPVQHWSQRGPFDRDKALWAGYLIDLPGGLVYFTGDTGLGTGWWVDETMKLAPRQVDVAMLAIGAYLPRWFMTPAHIDPPEAVSVFRKLNAKSALAIHWGMFPLGDDGPDKPLADLKLALEAEKIAPDIFRSLQPGEFWKVR